MLKILRIDSSARTADSVSRQLSDRLISRIAPDADVTVRDLADGIPLLSESTLGAMWTPEADRTDARMLNSQTPTLRYKNCLTPTPS